MISRAERLSLDIGNKNNVKLLNKYRDYIRHVTKAYTLSDSDLDEFVFNWNNSFDLTNTPLNKLSLEIHNPKVDLLRQKRVSIKGLHDNKGIVKLLEQMQGFELIDAFAVYGITKGTLNTTLKNTKLTGKLRKKLTRTRIHTKPEMVYFDARSKGLGMRVVMEDAKNMIYQHDLSIKPLWTREELNK